MTTTVTRVNPKTHCRYCGEELSYDEARQCSTCLNCHPPKTATPAPAKETKYLDVKLTEGRVKEMIKENEERIRDIVRDELENWHIQKPPVTREEVTPMVLTDTPTTFTSEANIPEQIGGTTNTTLANPTMEYNKKVAEEEAKIPERIDNTLIGALGTNWRKQAKALGIPLHKEPKGSGMRKKEDVLKDINARTSGETERPQEEGNI